MERILYAFNEFKRNVKGLFIPESLDAICWSELIVFDELLTHSPPFDVLCVPDGLQ